MLEVLRHFLDSGFLAKAGMRESDRQLLRDNMRDHNAFRAGEKNPSWRSALVKSGLMVFQLIEDGDWGGGGVTRVWNGSLWAGRLWVFAAGSRLTLLPLPPPLLPPTLHPPARGGVVVVRGWSRGLGQGRGWGSGGKGQRV